MRLVVINLDRSPERLTWFLAQARAAGLAVERLPACDGRDLTAEQCQALVEATAAVPLSRGEIACFLSHRNAWQLLLDSGEDWLAIFEDDVHLSPDAARFLGDAGWIPAGVGIVKLETMLEPTLLAAAGKPAPGGRRLQRLLGMHTGCAGYILSRRMARLLLDSTRRFDRPVDLLVFQPQSPLFARLDSYQLVPALCVQDNRLGRRRSRTITHPSTLAAERERLQERPGPVPKARLSLAAKAVREVSRPLRQFRDKACCLVTRGYWPTRRLVEFS